MQEPGMQLSSSRYLHRDMPGYHNTTRRDVVLDAPEVAATWKLPEPLQLRTSGPLVQMDAVSFAFPQHAVSGRPDQAASVRNDVPAGTSSRDQQSTAKQPTQPTAKHKWLLSGVTMCIEQVCLLVPLHSLVANRTVFKACSTPVEAPSQACRPARGLRQLIRSCYPY